MKEVPLSVLQHINFIMKERAIEQVVMRLLLASESNTLCSMISCIYSLVLISKWYCRVFVSFKVEVIQNR